MHIFESLHFPLTRAEHLHDVYVSKIRHLVSWVFLFSAVLTLPKNWFLKPMVELL